MIAVGCTVLGVFYALFCLLLAFINAGAGHGWISAIWISIPGTPLIVAGFHAAGRWREPGKDKLARFALGLLVLLDIALIAATRNEGVRYFEHTGGGGLLWLALWLVAHVPPATALYWRSELPFQGEP
ncbi:MAG: hypothetical protein O9293_12480 [Porphyrobacter sp.]|nr:hypothetical protein [Porphyrobacter sp.]